MVNAQQLYIATDDDGYTLEDDQPTPVLAGELPAEHQWLYGEEDGQDFDEDDGDGGHWILPEQPLTEETDLRDETYLEPLALVNAWEGAMMDLKEMHPERFLLPVEAPQSLVQKQAKASLWYGPPASEASTSKLPPQPQPQQLIFHAFPSPSPAPSASSIAPPASSRASLSANPYQPEPPKKRKRLTGSQKKARKAAKLENGQGAGGIGEVNGRGARNGKERAVEEDVEEDEEMEVEEALLQEPTKAFPPHLPHLSPLPAQIHYPRAPLPGASSPIHRPPSPSLSSAPSLPRAAPPTLASPSSFRFLVPPISTRTPRTMAGQFPQPPGITPLTGEEPPLEAETEGSLLESALWSWYTAGYQTALYHAAVGAAKFKHEEEGGAVEEQQQQQQ